jgi:hypothetical protein
VSDLPHTPATEGHAGPSDERMASVYIPGGVQRRSWMCRQRLLLIQVLKAWREVLSACSKAKLKSGPRHVVLTCVWHHHVSRSRHCFTAHNHSEQARFIGSCTSAAESCNGRVTAGRHVHGSAREQHSTCHTAVATAPGMLTVTGVTVMMPVIVAGGAHYAGHGHALSSIAGHM